MNKHKFLLLILIDFMLKRSLFKFLLKTINLLRFFLLIKVSVCANGTFLIKKLVNLKLLRRPYTFVVGAKLVCKFAEAADSTIPTSRASNRGF